MCSQVWGLTHSILVIFPLKFTGLLESNSAANAWCASAADAHPDIARPVTATTMASFVRIICLLLVPKPDQTFTSSAFPDSFGGPIPFEFCYRAPSILTTVPLIEGVARRHLARNVDDHRLSFPALDQRLLAKMSVHEFFGEFVAAEFEKLHVRLHAAVDRHRDAPWPREHLGVLDRHVVLDDVGCRLREALGQLQLVAVIIA